MERKAVLRSACAVILWLTEQKQEPAGQACPSLQPAHALTSPIPSSASEEPLCRRLTRRPLMPAALARESHFLFWGLNKLSPHRAEGGERGTAGRAENLKGVQEEQKGRVCWYQKAEHIYRACAVCQTWAKHCVAVRSFNSHSRPMR